jgi:peptidoglycan/LPS O-acetylase OafA/YrhL
MRHRPEIDGLRALAIAPVVAFHAGVPALSGGFVGVDVFFVISGFLITSIVAAEREAGRFSYGAFFERRARRILPALFVVMLATLPLAWMWLPPDDLRGHAQALVAVPALSANVLFWLKSGYFDAASELKPLLHAWSLSVEEQFYLLFPVVLGVLWRFGRGAAAAALAVLAAASLLLAQARLGADPSFAFFMLPTRAWELLLGAVLALLLPGGTVPASVPGAVREALAAAGLAMIVAAVLGFDAATPVPGLPMLLPTLGTALVIAAATDATLVGRLLRSGALVGLGAISYGVYLWHQPLFAFARHLSLGPPPAAVMGALAAAAVALGWLSLCIVERPMRDAVRWPRARVFGLLASVAVLLVALGLAGHATRGVAGRTPPPHLPAAYYEQAAAPLTEPVAVDGSPCDGVSPCRVHAGGAGAPRVLLAGDSHSSDHSAEFLRHARAAGLDAWQLSLNGCGFVPSHDARTGGACGRARQRLREAMTSGRFDRVIVVIDQYGHAQHGDADRFDADLDDFARTLVAGRLAGLRVVLFAPRPTLSAPPIRAAMLDRLDAVRPLAGAGAARIDALLVRLAARDGVEVFDETGVLAAAGCGAAACFDGHTAAKAPLYRDVHHLSGLGASLAFAAFVARTGGDAGR